MTGTIEEMAIAVKSADAQQQQKTVDIIPILFNIISTVNFFT